MAEGRGEFDEQKSWAKKIGRGPRGSRELAERIRRTRRRHLQNIVYHEELARAGAHACH